MEYGSQISKGVFADKTLSFLSTPRHLLPYRNPPCIANYKQKGKRNGELLIPIPGPPLQGHSSVIANKEIAIPNQTQWALFTLKTSGSFLTTVKPPLTAGQRHNTLIYTTVVFKYAPKNLFHQLLCALCNS